MRFLPLLVAVALFFSVATHVLAADGEPEFLANGLQMTTTLCGEDGSYSCSRVDTDTVAVVEAANQCAMTYHGIDERIMSDYKTSGARENCVLPNKMFTDVNGTNVWSVCCVRPAGSGQDCSLYCTRFISNKPSGKK
jgi:hypothetical protein